MILKGLNILQLSKNSSVKEYFSLRPHEVYGEPVELPQNEDTTPLNSDSLCGSEKCWRSFQIFL